MQAITIELPVVYPGFPRFESKAQLSEAHNDCTPETQGIFMRSVPQKIHNPVLVCQAQSEVRQIGKGLKSRAYY